MLKEKNMELTEEKKNMKFVLWTNKLKAYNCYSDSLVNDYGEKLTHGTFNMNEINGGCYDGSLIDVILNNLCTIGYHINEFAFGLNTKNKMRHQFLSVNMDMLMRVLLLQHISKAELFVPQIENWRKNKGFLFDYNGDMTSQLKIGERSAFMCMSHGIELSEIEFEAMTIIDKEEKQFNSHQNTLTALVRFTNQLAAIELQRKYDYNKKILQE